MNIVFACDRDYAQHLAVALCSLFENNRQNEIEVVLLNSDFDEQSLEGLRKIAKKYHRNLIDIKIEDEDLAGLVTTYHYTKGMYYRLLIAEKLNSEKALYLDADIVVNGSIKDLYDTDISDSYLGAVLNPGFDWHERLDMAKEAKYFNSGVMLLNLGAFRRDRLKEKVIKFIETKPAAVRFPDQCGLNSVVNGHWKELPPKFNLQGCFFEAGGADLARFFAEGELDSAIRTPVIIHFSGSAKPWFARAKHPYRKLYWQYLRKTPFRRVLPSDLTISKVAKWCMRKVL